MNANESAWSNDFQVPVSACSRSVAFCEVPLRIAETGSGCPPWNQRTSAHQYPAS
ncbi:Uncharacterised protein [Mycobacteroides abscessus subsp. abscessus]|nr:Uncharacterised protein [Mycobacteroides abscessus subsp. abscessus]